MDEDSHTGAIQAQQTKTASLNPVGRSDGSEEFSGTEASSEWLFFLGVPEESLPNASDAVTSVAFGGLTAFEEASVRIESDWASLGSN